MDKHLTGCAQLAGHDVAGPLKSVPGRYAAERSQRGWREAMFGLGLSELLILVAIVLFVFGWGRLPQLGSNLRQAIQNFKLMAKGGDEIDITPTTTEDPEGKESRHVR
jgi:sec-independent protein translocase protein TatA